MLTEYSVIVIGAGISGLVAAKQLQDSRVRNVLVVEAQDYVGGRIKTSHIWDRPIELGAEFIHGDNTVTAQISRSLKLDTRQAHENHIVLDSNGIQLSSDRRKDYENLINYMYANGKIGVSVQELIDKNPITKDTDLKTLAKFFIEDLESGDADKIDSGVFSESARRIGFLGQNIALRDGYGDIISHFASGLHIALNTVVAAIDYSDLNSIKITTRSGNTLTAQCAIITTSLGVLKQGYIQFIPKLPVEKAASVKRLGMGNACKIFVLFRSASTANAIFRIADAENESLQTITNWWNSALHDRVLVGYCGGSRVSALLSLPYDQLRSKIIKDLGNIIGKDVENEIVDLTISRWDTNEFIRGSYSYHPVGSSHNDNEILAKPTNNLLWAGEATVSDGNYAMVHGAISSGYRAAAEALEILKHT